ncbi:MAG: hypothetical protein KBD63_03055, partial [Bacteriovoracaceae bacterium]|nr:hypothetical protein [Bacteriovoracaceae bacterium]
PSENEAKPVTSVDLKNAHFSIYPVAQPSTGRRIVVLTGLSPETANGISKITWKDEGTNQTLRSDGPSLLVGKEQKHYAAMIYNASGTIIKTIDIIIPAE